MTRHTEQITITIAALLANASRFCECESDFALP